MLIALFNLVRRNNIRGLPKGQKYTITSEKGWIALSWNEFICVRKYKK
jgi:hypothetical protein